MNKVFEKNLVLIRYLLNNGMHPNHQCLNETIVTYELYLRTAMFQNSTKP